MVTDEQKCATIRHVDLHANQSWLLLSLLHNGQQFSYHPYGLEDDGV